jgi:pimeloyl-ACP methyl ester carboxylesterase
MEHVFERRGVGEPLVLLHGIGSRWQVFEPVLDVLPSEFEVWAVDMPGFGASPPATRPLSSIGTLADEVQAWIRAKGLGRCHIMGNSTGGGMALELAARGAVASAVGLAPISTRPRGYLECSSRAIAKAETVRCNEAKLVGAGCRSGRLDVSTRGGSGPLDPESTDER